MPKRQAIPDQVLVAVIAVWAVLYLTRGLAAHYALETNAYDLSLFDYAIWSLAHGGRGHVPFIGQSIFSQHFMPILGAIVPVYAVAPSPVTLIVLQVLAVAAAAWVYFRLQQRVALDVRLAIPLTIAFLFARRTHGATTSFFYPEAFQPLLTFACVLLWLEGRWKAYWTCAIALLMTKEDAAVYLAAFAVLTAWRQRERRRHAAWTAGFCVAWIVIALLVVIPRSRAADGLPSTNPFLADRFAASPGGELQMGALIDRASSLKTISTLVNLMAAVGFLPFAAAEWLVPAIPGIAVNLLARPDSMQASLIGHYFFAVMPWLFVAATYGLAHVHRRGPRVAVAWCGVFVIATLADSPAFRRLPLAAFYIEAQTAKQQLEQIRGDVLLVQPNLVPHLPHQRGIYTLGEGSAPPRPADMVAMTRIGDLWPFTIAEWNQRLEEFRKNAEYDEVLSGPVILFKRR